MNCGSCSRDGWIFEKNERGEWFARRCPCWIVSHPQPEPNR